MNHHFRFSNAETGKYVFLLITVYTAPKLNADILCNSSGILVPLKILADGFFLGSCYWSADLTRRSRSIVL